MTEFNFFVDKLDDKKRIDIYLSEKLNSISRNTIQKYINDGLITVNNKNIKPNYKININDKIFVKIIPQKSLEPKKEEISLNILYEDEDIIVIDKPKNMVVHPAPGHESGTLVNALLNHCELSQKNGVHRPGIIHRIDKDTSGVLVVAKNNEAHDFLASQLQNHTMKRKYIAVVFGNIKEENGTINKPIGRHEKDRKKMAVNFKNGKEAVTHYKVLKRFTKYTLIEARLETGRTHQIRVHMAFLGYPLLGDTVYGRKKQPFKLNGQVLHAESLGFIHPKKGEYIEFNSELPEYFIKLINFLDN